MAIRHRTDGDHDGWVAASACGLAAADNGVERVHVVVRGRSTDVEVTRYRWRAAARGLDLSVDGRGEVLVRPVPSASAREEGE